MFEQLIRQVPNLVDLYPILRLVFPEADVSRAAYGLQEHTVGRLFAELLVIPPQEKDRLLNWRDPNLQAKHNCTVGDFPSVLLSVIEPRLSSTPTAKLTVGEVNTFLTDLYTSTDKDRRRTLFRELIYKAKAVEIKWIIRILLKDLKLGMSIESILRHLHPNAISLYHISSSLENVLEVISSPNASTVSIFFQPIKPMLSERVNPSQIPQKFDLPEETVYLEPKLDGERMLVHVDKRTDRVAVISRNGVDFTDKYGSQNLTPFLLTCFKGLGAVFDGEMVSWDSNKNRIHAFGKNRSLAKTRVETHSSDEEPFEKPGHVMYVVFDLVYYVDADENEHDLRNTMLSDRRNLFDRILLPVLQRVEKIPYQLVPCTVEAVCDFLRSALDKKEEGIIIKRPDSLYQLNVRGRGGWYKIKSDYDDVFSDTLDLVVLGGYFGDARDSLDNSTLAQVSSFLVGVVNGPSSFKTVTKVGSGLSQAQMSFVRNRLQNSLVNFGDSFGLPEWLGDWRPSKGNRPDVLFSPFVNPVVLEVRAGEITPSSEFSSGYQLRFPRVVKPRTDKDFSDATSWEELKQIASADLEKDRVFIQRLAGRQFGPNHSKDPVPERKKRQKCVSVIKPHQNP